MKKYIFIFTILISAFLYKIISPTNAPPSIQMVVNTSPVNELQFANNIEKELSWMMGVSSYEFSLESDILLVNYDDKQIDDSDIVDILTKWGCDSYEISFNPIFN